MPPPTLTSQTTAQTYQSVAAHGLFFGTDAMAASEVDAYGTAVTLELDPVTDTYTLTIDAVGDSVSLSIDPVTFPESGVSTETGVSFETDASQSLFTSEPSVTVLDNAISIRRTTDDSSVPQLLVFIRPGAGSNAFTYSTLGFWESGTANPTAGIPNSVAYFATGIQTEDTNMPYMGTATYSGVVAASSGVANASALRGTGTMDVTFSDGMISTHVDFAPPDNSSVVATMDGMGTIAAGTATFSGDVTANFPATDHSTEVNLSGSFEGAFFGPVAAEAGYTFDLKSDGVIGPGLTGHLLGGFLGRR